MKNLKKFRSFFGFTQEELANKLSIDKNIITFYETGKSLPSAKVLKAITLLYEISYDYLILDDKSKYPQNLKLLKLAKQFDKPSHTEKRSYIETTIKALSNNEIENDIKIMQDTIEVELTNNFHTNLRQLRNFKGMTQVELAKLINVSRPVLGMYESKNNPPADKLIKLSEALNISIHALVTGEKLNFTFKDTNFGKAMLLADQLLPLEDQKFLIKLMENIIKQN